MTTKQRKQFATTLGICSIITILGGCQNETKTIGSTITEPTVIEANDMAVSEKTSTQDTTNIGENIAPQEQKLSINNKCIGCGYCTRVAGDTFTMVGRQAQVISQESIDSSAVNQAMVRCPVQAIEIIEV